MNPPPLPLDASQQRDADHIGLLSLFHFVLGALALLGIGFLIVHYLVMRMAFSHPEMWKGKGVEGPPMFLFKGLVLFYAMFAAVLVCGGIANILSGFFLRRRRFREFSLVVAAVNCLQIPFGTALGAFTISVLLRDSVRRSYLTDPPR